MIQMKKSAIEAEKDDDKVKTLTISLARTLMRKENPNELLAQCQGLENIGDLADLCSLRKLDLSFNQLTSLNGIEKLSRLKNLSAYCCRISNIDALAFASRLLTLRLQQNGICEIINCFTSMGKLRDLRLDRNKISVIQNISKCSSLRKLDLCGNQIESVDGLAGLQSLIELNLSGNKITSLRPLRALPSMLELDVSWNRLQSLDGIQNIPTLQVIKANNNELSTVRIPQTYSHLHKRLADDSSISDSSKKPSAGAKKDSEKKSLKAGTVTAKPASASVSSSQSTQSIGMTDLIEVVLNNNYITSLDGLDTLGIAIESLDLSGNRLDISSVMSLVSSLINLRKLTDLKISKNPFTADSSARANVADCLMNSCPSILQVDGDIIRVPEVIGSVGEDLDNEPDSKENVAIQSVVTKGDGDDDEDDEDEFNHNSGRAIPTLALKDLLSEKQIQLKEKEIRDLIVNSKETLALASTVFAFEMDNGETRNDAAVEALTKALDMKLKEGFGLITAIKQKKMNSSNKRPAAVAVSKPQDIAHPAVPNAAIGDQEDSSVVVDDKSAAGDDDSSVGMTFISSTKNISVLVAHSSGKSRPGSAITGQPSAMATLIGGHPMSRSNSSADRATPKDTENSRKLGQLLHDAIRGVGNRSAGDEKRKSLKALNPTVDSRHFLTSRASALEEVDSIQLLAGKTVEDSKEEYEHSRMHISISEPDLSESKSPRARQGTVSIPHSPSADDSPTMSDSTYLTGGLGSSIIDNFSGAKRPGLMWAVPRNQQILVHHAISEQSGFKLRNFKIPDKAKEAISTSTIEQQLLPVTSPRPMPTSEFTINFTSSSALHNYGSDAFQLGDSVIEDGQDVATTGPVNERLKEVGNRTSFVDTVRTSTRRYRGDPNGSIPDFSDFRTESTALDDIAEISDDLVDEM